MDESDPKPKMRPVEAFPVRMEGQDFLCLRDPESFAERPIFLNSMLMFVVSRMDGTNTLRDIQADFFRATGQILPFEDLEGLSRQLDEHHFLDSASFRSFHRTLAEEFRNAPSRPARHAGTAYEKEPPKLAAQLGSYFAHPEGPGEIATPDPARPLRGLISPHIDFQRGGPTYAHAYRALAEHPGADRYIIFGTCHNPMQQRFALTLKDYETPLGSVETDREFVRRLAAELRSDYLLDEFSHRAEHSIEFQTVWLRYILGDRIDFKVIPILVGSFHDVFLGEEGAAGNPEIQGIVESLRETMDALPGKYCMIAGADLAHVGRRFGDSSGPTESSLRQVSEEDNAFLELAVACDAEGVLASIAADNDHRRVCGYPPIYMSLRCLDNAVGYLLQYRQWADMNAGASVTYAAVAYY
ncbi:MAG TPA: AmmeMemoRadiSam system protein B [Acidobacteriota bacterium]|nr:AmmeMemoRadiSam system protein B [Acidobacteriota bacterium]